MYSKRSECCQNVGGFWRADQKVGGDVSRDYYQFTHRLSKASISTTFSQQLAGPNFSRFWDFVADNDVDRSDKTIWLDQY